jgi:hypothetical protein
VKRSLAVTVILLSILCSAMPRATFAGSKPTAEGIVEEAMELYEVPVQRDRLLHAVSESLKSGVPPDEVSVLVSALARAGRSAEETGAYLDTISDLHRAGMHSDLVLNTILEGVTKGIPGDRIQRSIASYREDLLYCRDLALQHRSVKKSPNSTTDLLIDTLFIALYAEFDRASIEEIGSVMGRETKSASFYIRSLEVMIELANLSLDAEPIVRLVASSVEGEYSIHELKAMPSLYREALRGGSSSEEAYGMLLARIERGESLTPSGSGESAGATGSGGRGASGSSSSGRGSGGGSSAGGNGGSGKGPGGGTGGSGRGKQ